MQLQRHDKLNEIEKNCDTMYLTRPRKHRRNRRGEFVRRKSKTVQIRRNMDEDANHNQRQSTSLELDANGAAVPSDRLGVRQASDGPHLIGRKRELH